MKFGAIAALFAGVSSIASAAYAQSVDAGGAEPVAPAAEPVQSSGDVTTGLQDIIVTAQRRAENLQRVPVAVTAISAEEIDQLRVINAKGMNGLSPSLQIQSQGLQSNPTIIIRGVASGASNNAVDPKIGIYIDGVYIGRVVGSLFDLADVERVEVLRGPQGTLFGRNATSGAISITTAAPKGELALKGNISYGNYDALRGKVSLDLPQWGPLSVKVSYMHDEIGGDARNLIGGRTIDFRLRDPAFGVMKFADKLGGRNTDSAQVAARLELGNLTADYRFDYTDTRSVGRLAQSFGVIPDASGQLLGPIVGLQGMFGGITNIKTDGRLYEGANATSEEHIVTQGHSFTLTLPATDTLTIKSITAFRKFRQDPNMYDLGASGGLKFTAAQLGALLQGDIGGIFNPANLPGPNDSFFGLLTARSTSQTQFSEELQAQLTHDHFSLTTGVFYFHENSPASDVLGIFQPVANGVVLPIPAFDDIFGSGVTRTRAINDSLAAYGQFTYHLTDTLDITGGIRYTADKRRSEIYAISGGQGAQLGIGTYVRNYSKVNYTGIVTWRPTGDITTYAKIATGYVAGGILSGIPYDPESLTSYELGFKSQFLDNRVRTNIALFYADYDKLQTQTFTGGIQYFVNAGKAKIKGAEVEVTAIPFQGLSLNGNFSYTDFSYDSYIIDGIDYAKDARTAYAAKWLARASAQYDAPEFSNGSHLYGRFTGRYVGKTPLVAFPIADAAGNVASIDQYAYVDPYWILDAGVGLVNLNIGGADVSVNGFANNLLNKQVNSFGATVLQLSTVYDRGRTYGVELGVKF